MPPRPMLPIPIRIRGEQKAVGRVMVQLLKTSVRLVGGHRKKKEPEGSFSQSIYFLVNTNSSIFAFATE